MLAVVTATLSLSASPLVGNRRQLSQTPIGKYAPNTDVLDHAAIDLDQKALEDAFGSTSPLNFADVQTAWKGAGYSKASAVCVLGAPAATAVAAGDKIKYVGTDGVAKESGGAAAATASGVATITFRTEVVQDQENARVKTGATGADIQTAGGVTIGYCASVTYLSGRTLQGFSTKAKDLMYDNAASTPPATCPAAKANIQYKNGCPYTSYVPYFNYYCLQSSSACHANGDYVNQWILSATSTPLSATGLDNFNMDFTTGTANQEEFRKDFIKKTSKFAGAWMYAVREFEDAIDDCVLEDLTANAYSTKSVHAWDEGVAFYVGSSLKATDFYDAVTGLEKKPPNKYLAYTLGNKRCSNFKTCGRTGDLPQGEAYVNFELWKQFGAGRDAILTGNCGQAVPIKNLIVSLMSVPLVQGTLRYSWYCTGKSCTSKAVGELAAFAASILPQVHACNAAAAAVIATAASPSTYTCTDKDTCTGAGNFAGVKAAFESCYSAMGMTCKEVGGLYDSNTLLYYAGGAPCSDSSTASDDDDLSTNAIIGIAIGAGAAVLLLLCLTFVLCKERAGTPLFVPFTDKPKV